MGPEGQTCENCKWHVVTTGPLVAEIYPAAELVHYCIAGPEHVMLQYNKWCRFYVLLRGDQGHVERWKTDL